MNNDNLQAAYMAMGGNTALCLMVVDKCIKMALKKDFSWFKNDGQTGLENVYYCADKWDKKIENGVHVTGLNNDADFMKVYYRYTETMHVLNNLVNLEQSYESYNDNPRGIMKELIKTRDKLVEICGVIGNKANIYLYTDFIKYAKNNA